MPKHPLAVERQLTEKIPAQLLATAHIGLYYTDAMFVQPEIQNVANVA